MISQPVFNFGPDYRIAWREYGRHSARSEVNGLISVRENSYYGINIGLWAGVIPRLAYIDKGSRSPSSLLSVAPWVTVCF